MRRLEEDFLGHLWQRKARRILLVFIQERPQLPFCVRHSFRASVRETGGVKARREPTREWLHNLLRHPPPLPLIRVLPIGRSARPTHPLSDRGPHDEHSPCVP